MTLRLSRNIPYAHQHISPDDIQAVVDVMLSDWLTQGPAIESFENTLTSYCDARYAVAVSSATAALHLCCIASDLGPGDRLWTSPNTFVASANCGRFCGAQIDFVDIDYRTLNMSVIALEEKLRTAEKYGKLPKVVVPVHFGGQTCEMRSIRALSELYGFTVIEDASHALGAEYYGRPVGSCEFSDMTVFSFHPVKIITTGEGGAILTNDSNLYERLILLRSHGITRDADQMNPPPNGPWDYQQVELGYNYRLTDIQAALGTSQLRRVDEFVTKRNELAAAYNTAFAHLPIEAQYVRPETRSAYHLFVLRLLRDCALTRNELFDELQTRGISPNVHYIPVHLQPYYRKLGFKPGSFPEAEAYYQNAITIPLYFDLSTEEQNYIIETMQSLISKR